MQICAVTVTCSQNSCLHLRTLRKTLNQLHELKNYGNWDNSKASLETYLIWSPKYDLQSFYAPVFSTFSWCNHCLKGCTTVQFYDSHPILPHKNKKKRLIDPRIVSFNSDFQRIFIGRQHVKAV